MGKIEEVQDVEGFLSELKDDIKDILKMIDRAGDETALDTCLDIKDILENYYNQL
jgi:hypothetical protein